MEIQALRVSVSEHDLNELIRRYLPRDQPFENVQVRLGADGIQITGQYPLFITVKFETAWEIGVVDGHAAAKLTRIKAMGVPGNVFKSAIMKLIEEAAKKEPWVRVSGDQVLADLEAASVKFAVAAQLRLRAITVRAGEIVIEAGG